MIPRVLIFCRADAGVIPTLRGLQHSLVRDVRDGRPGYYELRLISGVRSAAGDGWDLELVFEWLPDGWDLELVFEWLPVVARVPLGRVVEPAAFVPLLGPTPAAVLDRLAAAFDAAPCVVRAGA